MVRKASNVLVLYLSIISMDSPDILMLLESLVEGKDDLPVGEAV
jgi:hypothetical protein